MAEPNWDEEQRRLLTELNKIDMPEMLWLRLDAAVRQWVNEQKESDRRWHLREKEHT